MKAKIFLTLSFLIIGVLGFSQEKEVIVSDGVKSNISSISVDMYNGTKSAKAQQFFDTAFTYAKNNDYKNAEKFYLKAIKEDANFIEVYDNLGRVYRRTGKLDKAITYYLKSIKLYPDGIMAHQNLAVVYGLKKEYQKAIAQYKEIVRISPKNPEGYFGLANSYMMISDFDEALVNAKKTVKIYKATKSHYISDGYYLTGLISYYAGKKEEAKKYLLLAKEKGVKIDARIEEELFSDKINIGSINFKSKEDYANYEQEVIKGYDWLMATQIGVETQKRSEITAFLIKWMTGTPNVSIELNEKVITYMDCTDCLVIFMGGWTKYALETKDYNKLNANLAGTNSVIEFYQFNKKKLGKNKKIEKLIKLKQKGTLKKYIKSKL